MLTIALLSYVETRDGSYLANVSHSPTTFEYSKIAKKRSKRWNNRWCDINSSIRTWNKKHGTLRLNKSMNLTTERYKSNVFRIGQQHWGSMDLDDFDLHASDFDILIPQISKTPLSICMILPPRQILSMMRCNTTQKTNDLLLTNCLQGSSTRARQMLSALFTNEIQVLSQQDICDRLSKAILPPVYVHPDNVIMGTDVCNRISRAIVQDLFQKVTSYGVVRLAPQSSIMNMNPFQITWVLISVFLSFEDVLHIRSLCTSSVGLIPAPSTCLAIDLSKTTYDRLRASNGRILKQLLTTFDNIKLRVYRGRRDDAYITLRDIIADGRSIQSFTITGPGDGIWALMSKLNFDLIAGVKMFRLRLTTGEIAPSRCFDFLDTIINAFPELVHLEFDTNRVESLLIMRAADINTRQCMYKTTLDLADYRATQNTTLRTLCLKGTAMWRFDPFVHRLYTFSGLRNLEVDANIPYIGAFVNRLGAYNCQLVRIHLNLSHSLFISDLNRFEILIDDTPDSTLQFPASAVDIMVNLGKHNFQSLDMLHGSGRVDMRIVCAADGSCSDLRRLLAKRVGTVCTYRSEGKRQKKDPIYCYEYR
jgi:hypothetical protein